MENPPAFPNSTFRPGMSLRDWFAGQALSGVLANPSLVVALRDQAKAERIDPDTAVAKFCNIAADAMLAERAKRGEA